MRGTRLCTASAPMSAGVSPRTHAAVPAMIWSRLTGREPKDRDRTTDATGLVETRSLAELKALSAGCGRPEFASERVPTLAELCALLPPDRGLALELKSDRFLDPEVGRRFLDEIIAAGGARPALENFRAFRGRDPEVDALLRHSGMIAG